MLGRVGDDHKALATLALQLNSSRQQPGNEMAAITPRLLPPDVMIHTLHSRHPPEIENDY